MDSKAVMWIVSAIGGAVGSYGPVLLFHVDPLGGWSILGGTVGAIAGIAVWVKYLRG